MSIKIKITNFHVLRHRIFKVDPIVYVNFLKPTHFSKWCATYNLVGINDLSIGMHTL